MGYKWKIRSWDVTWPSCSMDSTAGDEVGPPLLKGNAHGISGIVWCHIVRTSGIS